MSRLSHSSLACRKLTKSCEYMNPNSRSDDNSVAVKAASPMGCARRFTKSKLLEPLRKWRTQTPRRCTACSDISHDDEDKEEDDYQLNFAGHRGCAYVSLLQKCDSDAETEFPERTSKASGPCLCSAISLGAFLGKKQAARPTATPPGYFAVYVGKERRRFFVKASSFSHPLFVTEILEKAKEEFGFEQKGPLTIPCEITFFEQILFRAEHGDNVAQIHVSSSSPQHK